MKAPYLLVFVALVLFSDPILASPGSQNINMNDVQLDFGIQDYSQSIESKETEEVKPGNDYSGDSDDRGCWVGSDYVSCKYCTGPIYECTPEKTCNDCHKFEDGPCYKLKIAQAPISRELYDALRKDILQRIKRHKIRNFIPAIQPPEALIAARQECEDKYADEAYDKCDKFTDIRNKFEEDVVGIFNRTAKEMQCEVPSKIHPSRDIRIVQHWCDANLCSAECDFHSKKPYQWTDWIKAPCFPMDTTPYTKYNKNAKPGIHMVRGFGRTCKDVCTKKQVNNDRCEHTTRENPNQLIPLYDPHPMLNIDQTYIYHHMYVLCNDNHD